MYKFNELPQTVQLEIINCKLLDIDRQGLTLELSKAILDDENIILEQCYNELYDIQGNYIKDIN